MLRTVLTNHLTSRRVLSIPRKGNARVVVLRIVRQIRLCLVLIVLRLFSMFPAGVPGIALLLLRIGVSATIFATGWNSQVPVPVLLVLALHCLFLCLGIFTPLLAALGCAFELVTAAFTNYHSIVAVLSSSLDAAAVAMLGPGAYSLDARRFGHRVIHFPPEETSNRS
jgi:hypothetical protein